MIWRVALAVITATVAGCASKPAPDIEAQGSSHCGDLPPGWTTQKLFIERLNQVPGIVDLGASNRLLMTKTGKILWNHKTVTKGTLGEYIDLLGAMRPVPMLYVHVEDGAPCHDVETLHQMLAPICREGHECIDTTKADWRELYPHDAPI